VGEAGLAFQLESELECAMECAMECELECGGLCCSKTSQPWFHCSGLHQKRVAELLTECFRWGVCCHHSLKYNCDQEAPKQCEQQKSHVALQPLLNYTMSWGAEHMLPLSLTLSQPADATVAQQEQPCQHRRLTKARSSVAMQDALAPDVVEVEIGLDVEGDWIS